MNETTQRPLPSGWRWVRLHDLLVSLETGGRPKGGAVGITAGVPSLSAEHMTRFGTFEFSLLRFVPREFFDQMSRGHIKRGDILIVKDGATTGKAAFVGDEFPLQEAVINEHVFLCRPKCDLVFPRYLFLWLWGPEGQSAIRSNYQGAAIGGISQRFVESVFVPLPPLPEQQRIAAILSEQMAAVEQARAAAQARLEAAKALPAAYLRAVFNSPEAREWPRKRLGDLALLVQNGIYKSADKYGHGHPFLRMYNVQNDSWRLSLKTMAHIELEAGEAQTFGLRSGDLLVSRVNSFELVGKCAWVGPEADGYVFENMLIRLRLGNSVDSLFAAQQMSIRAVREQIEKVAKRAIGQASVNSKDLRDIQIALPSLPEQQRIAAILSEQMAAVERARKALQEELDTINKLPAALLRRAFEGGI